MGARGIRSLRGQNYNENTSEKDERDRVMG